MPTRTTFVCKSVFLPFLNKVASLLLQVFSQNPRVKYLARGHIADGDGTRARLQSFPPKSGPFPHTSAHVRLWGMASWEECNALILASSPLPCHLFSKAPSYILFAQQRALEERRMAHSHWTLNMPPPAHLPPFWYKLFPSPLLKHPTFRPVRVIGFPL